MTLSPNTEKTAFYNSTYSNLSSVEWYNNTAEVATKLPGMVEFVNIDVVKETGGHFAEVFSIELRFATPASPDTPTPDSLFLIAKLVGSSDISQGYQREIAIYKEMLSSLQESGVINVPKYYYGNFDPETGGKVLILGQVNSIICGRFFGESSPHNHDVVLDDILGKFKNLTDIEITRRAFVDIAHLHSTYWNSTSIPDYIRGVGWIKAEPASQVESSQGEKDYNNFMKMARDNWPQKAYRPNIVFDPYLDSIIDASLNFSTWQRFRARFDAKSHPYTLLHSDFYPGNALVCKDTEQIFILDFECSSVGCGPQDCAQWVISHLDPTVRKENELSLLTSYYNELTTFDNSKVKSSDYTFEMCQRDYIASAGKWIWLIAIVTPMLNVIPDKLYQHFITQLASFCKTHNVQPDENVPLPRP